MLAVISLRGKALGDEIRWKQGEIRQDRFGGKPGIAPAHPPDHGVTAKQAYRHLR